MGKIIVIIAIIAAGYWYWTGPYQQTEEQTYQAYLDDNAKTMKRCMGKQSSIAGAAGLAGVGGMAEDSETFCAEENNLVLHDGQWHSKNEVRD